MDDQKEFTGMDLFTVYTRLALGVTFIIVLACSIMESFGLIGPVL